MSNKSFINEVSRVTRQTVFSLPVQFVWNGHVTFELQNSGGSVWLFSLRSLERGKGYGSLVLDWLCRVADKHSATLSLIPAPFGEGQKLSYEDLCRWYERHGFEWTTTSMVRKPRG